MLRELKTNGQKMADATYVAGANMYRGMGVVKGANNTADFPSAATGVNVFVVDKQPIATGINSLIGEISDYDDIYDKVAKDEPVVLKAYVKGEEIATDQVDTGLTADDYLVVGTDGKWAEASAGDVAYAICKGTYDDAGHTLTIIEFIDPYTVPSGT